MYAIAIDLGTTTLAASLIECRSGVRIAMTGSMNPQRRFGADVVSRLDAAVNSDEARQEMAALVRRELLRLASELCTGADVAWNEVELVAIAGNPAMQHLLLGLEVQTLAFPPYRPHHTHGTRLKAVELEWDGSADVYVFPMPGGFVGGDTVAFVFGNPAPRSASLLLDMGTNGELALLSGETVWATSAAAGPAFEGGNLSCGMAALDGAISSVRIEGERVKLATIGSGTPTGICGSGVIGTICELLDHDILEPGGRLRDCGEIPSNLATRIIRQGGENAFVVYRDARRTLLLTQADIRQVQLAKGAIRAGIEVLLQRSGLSSQALQGALLTGSFGAVLRPEWLKKVGIFDQSMLQDTLFTPEGALCGVERAIAVSDDFTTVEELATRFRVVPLSGTPLFESLFLKHLDFPSD
jgi:uncharacterized 2Fe-2S/4Fe-4S cluster protein (DUF4445 family)